MFNMIQVGKKIASLRKKANLTQLELADKLGITYQAVSNWERGDTMPDISKLTDLADILEVSVDMILDDEKKAATISLINNEQTIDLSLEEITDVAPILKPNQIENFIKENNKLNVSVHLLIQIAPFIESDSLASLIQDDNIFTLNDLIAIAPFLDNNALTDIIKTKLSRDEILASDVVKIAPFITASDIFTLIKDSSKFTIKELIKLAPFINNDNIGYIIEEKLNSSEMSPKDLISLAPFVKSSCLNKLYNSVDLFTFDDLVSLAPFMQHEDLLDIIKNRISISEIDENKLLRIVPFIGNEGLVHLFQLLKNK